MLWFIPRMQHGVSALTVALVATASTLNAQPDYTESRASLRSDAGDQARGRHEEMRENANDYDYSRTGDYVQNQYDYDRAQDSRQRFRRDRGGDGNEYNSGQARERQRSGQDRSNQERDRSNQNRDDESSFQMSSLEEDDAAIGISLRDSDRRGPVISFVHPNSPASNAGIRRGDVLLRIDGERVRNFRQVVRRIHSMETGSQVDLQLLRNNETRDVTVRLETRREALVRGRASGEGQRSRSNRGNAGSNGRHDGQYQGNDSYSDSQSEYGRNRDRSTESRQMARQIDRLEREVEQLRNEMEDMREQFDNRLARRGEERVTTRAAERRYNGADSDRERNASDRERDGRVERRER